jgi:hypothetical protein
MVFDDSFWRALADYKIKFPDKPSLGLGNPPAAWLVAYNAAREDAFGSVLILNATSEGGGGGGLRNFSQETLLDALHACRFELDPTYELPPHLATFTEMKLARSRGKRGFLMSFKPAS